MGQIISACLQHRHEAPTAVQSDQIIATTHMRFTNEDLGNGAPARQAHHAISIFGGEVDAHLFDLLDAARFKKLLGPIAIGTNRGGVHLDGGHDGEGGLGFFQG